MCERGDEGEEEEVVGMEVGNGGRGGRRGKGRENGGGRLTCFIK